jgi:peptidoglycan/xylan/chitin deacetylase (PgdA/CDA1 family)
MVGLTEALGILRRDSASRVVALTFDDGLLDFLNAVDVLLGLGARATLYVPTATVGLRASRWDRDRSRLSWAHIRGIASAGIEIGSQAVSGRPLDTGSSVGAELHDSRRTIEDEVGRAVSSFCYPGGRAGPQVRSAVAAAGYRNACTLGPGTANAAHDPLMIPRIRVRPTATGPAVHDTACTGESGVLVRMRRLAVPAWQVTRRTAHRIPRQLTTKPPRRRQ